MIGPAASRADMHVVAAVVDQGALTFDFAIPCEVFGLDRSDIVDPWYEFLVVAAGDRGVRTQTGFVLEAPHGLEALERAETIVVPGWSDPDDEPSAALCESLVAAHERGARIVSLCTGAFVLGAAGLLDGRRATTHWMYADRLRARYPLVHLDPDVLYVVDGRVMTSAGTAAGVDLCLHLVALDHGVEVAAAVARRLDASAVRRAPANVPARVPPHLPRPPTGRRVGDRRRSCTAPTMAGPALLAQLVEHLHGKEGVDGSSPSEGSSFREVPGNRLVLLSERASQSTSLRDSLAVLQITGDRKVPENGHVARYDGAPP